MNEVSELYGAILSGDAKTAAAAAKREIENGSSPMDLVSRDMIPAMDEVGRRFECEEYFVPELLLSGRAMKAALGHIRPLLAASGVQPTGKVVIGTVKGDLHDIGKNLVASMLEGGGFEVHDLGADVGAEQFVEATTATGAHIVCLSALLTVTMPAMRQIVEALKEAGLRERVKILIGGAPVTSEYAAEIGADGFSENASAAVALAREMVAQNV